MAPRDTAKSPNSTPKVQRRILKSSVTKGKSTPTTIKKTMSTKKPVDKTLLKVSNTPTERQRTNTVPKLSTSKQNEKTTVPVPSNVTKSAKKPSWKRRPKPAHSGVPVPEKMKKLLDKQLQDSDCSF